VRMTVSVGTVLLLLGVAAAWSLWDATRNDPTDRECRDVHQNIPGSGRIRLSGCQVQLSQTVLLPKKASFFDTLIGHSPTPQLFVPLWMKGEPPPERYGVLLQITEPFVIDLLVALNRSRSEEELRSRAAGAQAHMAMAAYADFEAGVFEPSTEQHESLQLAFDGKLEPQVMLLSRAAPPRGPSLLPVALGLGALLLFGAWLFPKYSTRGTGTEGRS
jgi:hypothetical protein